MGIPLTHLHAVVGNKMTSGILETRSVMGLPVPSRSWSQLKRLSLRGLDPLNGEPSKCLEIAIPCGEIFSGGVPVERVQLNVKDVGSQHIDTIEVNLGDVAFSGERDSRVTVKTV